MKKLYSEKRWNQQLGGKVVGKRKSTEEDKKSLKKLEKYAEKCMKNIKDAK